MPNIQIRHVSDDEHRRLKARAALAGQSLSEYALTTLRRSLDRPPAEELLERLEHRGTVAIDADVTALVRAERDAR